MYNWSRIEEYFGAIQDPCRLSMATKIKDGLFVGDADASQDADFIELNKITYVINCAGRQLPNLWEQQGLNYLTFPWAPEPQYVLFDSGNIVVAQVSYPFQLGLWPVASSSVHKRRSSVYHTDIALARPSCHVCSSTLTRTPCDAILFTYRFRASSTKLSI